MPERQPLRMCLGLVQKLTAREKTSESSLSEVDVLCSGQSSSTQRSSGSTFSAVLLEETITLHMVTAALHTQNSVSVGSWPQQHGLGSCRVPSWFPSSASAHCPSPAAPSQTAPVGSRWPSDGALRGREGAWQQALGPTCHDWEAEGSEWPESLPLSASTCGAGSTGWWTLRLINPEPSSQVLLVPVTGWGTPQEGHHHIMWLCKGHLLQGIIQPVLNRYIRDE